MYDAKHIRNVAIIAHIDHGKTTLLDALLKQSKVFQDHEVVPERVMDSYDQEKERGITIFAKHTAIFYKDHKINIIDTPGHADFAGEVERVLGMVNCVLLLIDAKEGPMPQTRFVLKKSLEMGLKPIVILNKIDRPHADPENALNQTFDLFVELGATDEQLDFTHAYVSGLEGYALKEINDPKEDMQPLFDLILEHVPVPEGHIDEPFLMQTATIDYDPFLGRQACGRILAGHIKKGDGIQLVNYNDEIKPFKVQKIEGYHGLKKVELDEAAVGDIVTIAGAEDVTIGDTLSSSKNTRKLKKIAIEEPTVSIDIMVNAGPFAGKDGKHVTMNKIKERLVKEQRANATLKITIPEGTSDKIIVAGRGELHLSVLLEAMRREQFEMVVSKPQVILKKIDGEVQEPIEATHIELPEEFAGSVIEELGLRKGEMQSMSTNEHGITLLDFLLPTRAIMGFQSELLTMTKGLAIMTSVFDHYGSHRGEISGRKRGVLIALSSGQANSYAIDGLQKRATLFVKPGDEVYEGMVVGENSRENDLVVNITKGKQLTNVRSSNKDDGILLTPPRVLTLEESINYIEDDELVEITPHYIRLRKRFLNEVDRKRNSRTVVKP